MRRAVGVLWVLVVGVAATQACSDDDGSDGAGEVTVATATTTAAQSTTTVTTAAPTGPSSIPITAGATAPSTLEPTTSTSGPVIEYDLSSEPTCSMAAPVELGSTGEDVRCLQERLQQVRSGGDPIAVDGEFGPATDQAVRQFQDANDLVVDGVVGAQTAELLGVWAPTATSAP
jgi:murein L,D-transpeptidase YcbB/YkuD